MGVMRRAARVNEVVMRTVRDDAGICYGVWVGTDDGDGWDGDDGERLIWSWTVFFGSTDATMAGGARFLEAAHCQQRVADEVWSRFHGVNADDRWFPASADQWKAVQP